jgi:hypothetical protein
MAVAGGRREARGLPVSQADPSCLGKSRHSLKTCQVVFRSNGEQGQCRKSLYKLNVECCSALCQEHPTREDLNSGRF